MSECLDCRFWKRSLPDKATGTCRRRAPTPDRYKADLLLQALVDIATAQFRRADLDPPSIDVEDDFKDTAFWPITDADEWCGEYQPAGAA